MLSPDGRYLYASLNAPGEVVKVDLSDDRVVDTAHTGVQARSLAIATDGKTLYVVNYDSDTVTMLDALICMSCRRCRPGCIRSGSPTTSTSMATSGSRSTAARSSCSATARAADRHPMEPLETELTIASADERALATCVIAMPGERPGRPAILFVHGLHSDQRANRRRALAAAREFDAVCLTFDLGGHGRSEGDSERLAPADHLSDLRVAADALLQVGAVDQRRLGVCGASYGAYLSALLVVERPVRRLLLRAPALYPDEDLLGAPLSQRRAFRQTVVSSQALRGLERFDGATLVVESEHDETIPPAVVAAYVAAAPDARHELLARAPHALLGARIQRYLGTSR